MEGGGDQGFRIKEQSSSVAPEASVVVRLHKLEAMRGLDLVRLKT